MSAMLAPPAYAPRSTQPKAPVLIIDDDYGPRESLKILLKYDFTVEAVESIAEGVRKLRARSFDAVVLDNRMPGRSGLEGIADLREVDPDISVIMLTGHGTLETAVEAFRNQATDFMTKPPETDLMIATVGRNAALTRAKRARAVVTRELAQLNASLTTELSETRPLARMGLHTDEIIHDMGNPLTVLTCCIDMLQAKVGEMPPEAGEKWLEALGYIQMIKNSVQHCCGLADTWRQLRDNVSQQHEKVSAGQFLRETVDSLEPMAAMMNVTLRLEASDVGSEASVKVDTIQMRRVIHNLIINAMQASEAGGRAVWVEARTADSELEVTVADNGPGISADRLPKIFEPYYSTKQNGTGLGLAISKRIVGEHAGTLRAESVVGKGSTFCVRLPLTT